MSLQQDGLAHVELCVDIAREWWELLLPVTWAGCCSPFPQSQLLPLSIGFNEGQHINLARLLTRPQFWIIMIVYSCIPQSCKNQFVTILVHWICNCLGCDWFIEYQAAFWDGSQITISREILKVIHAHWNVHRMFVRIVVIVPWVQSKWNLLMVSFVYRMYIVAILL